MTPPSLILDHAYAYWGSAILAAALELDVFTQLASTAGATCSEVATRAQLDERGTQALLDGLVGLRLVSVSSDRYINSPEAATYLVKSSPHYMGAYAELILGSLTSWTNLPAVIRSGKALSHQEEVPESPFWEPLVRALAPTALAPASAAAERVQLDRRKTYTMLDIGGGSGAWSATWLRANAAGSCVQIDWKNVNTVANRYVQSMGIEHGFRAIDGDMELLELGTANYDFVVYANVSHGLSAERNVAMFRKVRSALKRDGTLIVCSFVLDDDRTGNLFSLMFGCNLLLHSKEGSIHTRSDMIGWLNRAGFEHVEFEPLEQSPLTLVFAR